MTIKIGENLIPFEVASKSSSASHEIKLLTDPDKEKLERLKLSLAPIKSFSEKQSDLTIMLEAIDALKIARLEAHMESTEAAIKVFTSQKINEIALKNNLEIKPAIKYTINSTYYGFDILSDEIELGNNYSIVLKQGLTGDLGGKLKKTYQGAVTFGQVSPEIEFANEKAIYLGKDGFKNVNVKVSGVAKVKISVYKIFENNINHFFSESKRYGSHYDYDDDTRDYDYYNYGYYDVSDYGQLVFEKDMAASNMKESGLNRLLHLDFADKLPDRKGIYVVKVQDTERYYISDSKIVSLSDIGIIAKQDKRHIFVFTNSSIQQHPLSVLK